MKKVALNYGLGIKRGQEYEVMPCNSRFYLVLLDGKYELRHRDIFDAGFVDFIK